MNQEQTNVSVDVTTNIQQRAAKTLFDEEHEVREYYLRQLRLMCPTIKKQMSDRERLSTLKKRTDRLIEMLTLLERSWVDDMPVLQKACLTYLTTEILSQKERQQVIEAWAGWSDFQFRFARYRGLLAQFLQYHHRIREELESLLNPADAGTSSEPQETTEKGGE